MHSTTNHTCPSEVTILARLLANEAGKLSATVARHFLNLGFGDDDKARMHDLAVRNQGDVPLRRGEGGTVRLRQGRHPAFHLEIQGPPNPSHPAQKRHSLLSRG